MSRIFSAAFYLSDDADSDADSEEFDAPPARAVVESDDDDYAPQPQPSAPAPADVEVDEFKHPVACKLCEATLKDGDAVCKSQLDVVSHATCARRARGYSLFTFQVTCSVCLADFVRDERVVLLKCGHVFHTPCMERWMPVGHSCPHCRQSTLA